MNGVHDMGGLDGFGRLPGDDGRLFRAEWERRLFGVFVAIMNAGLFPVHRIRHANERMPPRAYLAATYYERWLYALETCLMEGGYMSACGSGLERRAGMPLSPQEARLAIRTGHSDRCAARASPKFRVGQCVSVSVDAVATHTRVPRYVRGRSGRIVMAHGSFVFPDLAAHSGGAVGEHLYTVRFAADDLWGARSDANSSVRVDLFEPYLRDRRCDEGACR